MIKTLSRKRNFRRCSFLDRDGHQCRLPGRLAVNYHGDGELYQDADNRDSARWVRVHFCKKHFVATDPSIV